MSGECHERGWAICACDEIEEMRKPIQLPMFFLVNVSVAEKTYTVYSIGWGQAIAVDQDGRCVSFTYTHCRSMNEQMEQFREILRVCDWGCGVGLPAKSNGLPKMFRVDE